MLLAIFCNYLSAENKNIKRANETLNRIYKCYSIENSFLLHETYPFNENNKATYLANSEQAGQNKMYSYLWPYSGSLSAVSALYEATFSKNYLYKFNHEVLPGLEMYLDTLRHPSAYASYIHSEPLPDRFYDDNIWIGIDLTDMYLLTKNKSYLNQAKMILQFIESGTDSLLGGGIYWVEQNRKGKHTCSNAPGAVFALKLFEATKDSVFFDKGKALYDWTKEKLQDKNDFLYYDNVNLNGDIDKKKYAYNSGQMLQAASILYLLTNDVSFFDDAQHIAASSYNYFFNDFVTESGERFRLLQAGDIWFTSVMLRGFIEFYKIDKNPKYIDAFQQNLNYAWEYMRDEDKLFNTDWSGQARDKSKWLLTQFGMVEMYARMGALQKQHKRHNKSKIKF